MIALNKKDALSICRLCKSKKPLKNSHIFPAFIFRWLRETSANGHLRTAQNPNQRTQDGMKLPFLCLDCEGVLNKFETLFKNRIFDPYLSDASATIKYQDWMLRFCVSISWRVLAVYREQGWLKKYSDDQLALVDEALEMWRQVLLGHKKHPERFIQHFIPLSEIANTSISDLPKNINRYLMRGVEMDIAQNNKALFTHAKIGRFIILGFVKLDNPQEWKGSKILSMGTVSPRKFTMPTEFLDYLLLRARKMSAAGKKISKNQQDKIDKALFNNVGKLAESDFFEALRADYEMFGKDAFKERG